MKIAVLDDYQDVVKSLDCFKLLKGHDVHIFNETYVSPDVLASKLAEFEALVLIRERTHITEELLSRLPELKLISQTGKISNHLNLEVCDKYNVTVTEGVGSPVAPSELCWGLIMAASRNITEYVSSLSRNQWQQSGSLGLGRILNGLTIGIWGYGNIGQRIAQYAKTFGMHVLVWGSESSRLRAQEHGFSAASGKADFFSSADVVSLHLRLNEVTRGCVTRADLRLMKADSLFVNTSRSELVETGALFDVLSANPTRRAALDVYDVEPVCHENEPLLSLANVLCSPHLGYVEKNNYELYFKIAFENVVAFAQGKPQNLAAS